MNKSVFISKLDLAISLVTELKRNTRSDSLMFAHLDIAHDLLLRCMTNSIRSKFFDKVDSSVIEHIPNEDGTVPPRI